MAIAIQNNTSGSATVRTPNHAYNASSGLSAGAPMMFRRSTRAADRERERDPAGNRHGHERRVAPGAPPHEEIARRRRRDGDVRTA